MAALLFKVGLLTLKTAAKPLAKQFEVQVMSHPVARKKVIDLAQWLHALEVGINRGAEGKSGKVFVASMTEDKAVELASKVASEGFLYGIGVLLVAVEIYRKNKEDTQKKARELVERQQIRDLHERHLQSEQDLKAHLGAVSQQLHSLDERLRFMEGAMAGGGRKRSWLPLFG